jgi:hypothetical protein
VILHEKTRENHGDKGRETGRRTEVCFENSSMEDGTADCRFVKESPDIKLGSMAIIIPFYSKELGGERVDTRR